MTPSQVNPGGQASQDNAVLGAHWQKNIRAKAHPQVALPDRLNLLLGLSVLLLIVTSDKSVLLFGLSSVVAGLCFCLPRLRQNGWFWLAIAAFLAVRNVTVWQTLDDHIAVANYWIAALGLSLLTTDPRQNMRHTACWLIGLVFAFATFWKATSAEYMNGAFFEYTLLLDDRFVPIAQWLGGVSTEQLADNYRQMAIVREAGASGGQFVLHSTARVALLAQLLTWWTVCIEGLVAVLFLFSRFAVFRLLRNAALILFALTTYVPVPVTGFCATLMVLGIAQTTEKERRAVIGYLAVLALILIWTPIWRTLIYLG